MSADAAFATACREQLAHASLFERAGRVCAVVGSVVEVEGLGETRVGAVCRVEPSIGSAPGFSAEVVGFR